MDRPSPSPRNLEKRDDQLGISARYRGGGATVRLVDGSGRVLRRVAVGEVPTKPEVEEAIDYLLAMAWAEAHVRR